MASHKKGNISGGNLNRLLAMVLNCCSILLAMFIAYSKAIKANNTRNMLESAMQTFE